MILISHNVSYHDITFSAGFSWWEAWGPAGASLGAHKTPDSRPWGRGWAP